MRELTTERLRLVPAGHADLDALWRLWTEPEVRRYLWDDVEIPRERAAEVLDGLLAAGAETGRGLWTIRADGETVGCCGLVVTTSPEEPDPLCALLPAHQGRGYAAEALRALIAHAFADLGVRRLAATVDVPNQASHRLVHRLGFTRVGEEMGPRWPMLVYALEPAGRR